jgi:hypothetical protein
MIKLLLLGGVMLCSCITPSKYDLELAQALSEQSKTHVIDMMKMNEELMVLKVQIFMFQQGFMHQTPFYGKPTRVR